VLIINKGTLLLNEYIKHLKGKSLEAIFRETTTV